MNVLEIIEKFNSQRPDDVLKSVSAFFQLPIIPEYLPSEMLMAACYRALGFGGMKDAWVSQNGKALSKLFTTTKAGVECKPFSRDEVWKILKDVLLSPEDPKQKRGQKYTDFLFLAPIVPATAYFSNPVRLNRNTNAVGGTPWNVELLFKALVSYSSVDTEDSNKLWNAFFEAFAVQNDDRDDYFARIVEDVLNKCAAAVVASDQNAVGRFPEWKQQPNSIYGDGRYLINSKDRKVFSGISPLDEIRSGLWLVLKQKRRFSRWQWLTVVDAQLRMSVVALVMWLLDLHHVVYTAIQKYVIEGQEITEEDPTQFFRDHYLSSHFENVFCYGEGFTKAQKLVVTRYAREHLKVSFFLSLVKELAPMEFGVTDWSTVEGFVASLKALRGVFMEKANRLLFEEGVVKMLDDRAADLNPKKSRLKHILEFFTVLRQKSVVESQSDFIRYDQSYIVRKKANYSSAPFIVDIGSVACFTIVFCCANGRRVFAFKDLCQYLEKYYISVRKAHRDQFINYLKGLSLTMDSPDAGDGLMISNPFYEEEDR